MSLLSALRSIFCEPRKERVSTMFSFLHPTKPVRKTSPQRPASCKLHLEAFEERCLLSTYSAVILGDQPAAYYRLGEVSGTTAFDSSGNNHTGSYLGGPALGQPGALAGDSDTSVGFNGVSSIVDTNYKPGDPSFTVEAWVRPTAAIAQQWVIAGRGGAGQLVYNAWDGFSQPVHATPGYAGISIFDGVAFDVTLSTATLPLNQWTYLAGTWNDSTKDLNLYVNGVLNHTSTFVGKTSVVGEPWTTLQLGAFDETLHGGSYKAQYFQGGIDEVAYYSSALTSAQVLQHYQAGTELHVWTGLGPDNNWSDPANWQGGVAPNPGDALVFPSGASQLANNNDFPNGTSFASLTFTGAGYDISGDAITLTSGMTTNISPSGGSDTVEDNLIFPTDVTFSLGPKTGLELTGNLSGNGGLSAKNSIGSDPAFQSSVILGGNDNYAGTTKVDKNTHIDVEGSLDASSDIITTGFNSRFVVSGTLTVEQNITMSGLVVVDPGGTVDDSGSIAISAQSTFLDQSFGNGSAAGVRVEQGGSLLVQGTFTNQGDFAGTLDDYGLVTVTGQLLDRSLGDGSIAGVQVEQGASLAVQGTVTIDGSTTLRGTLDDFGSISVTSGGTLLVNGSGNGVLPGLQVEPGAILANQGTVQAAGTATDNGILVVNGLMTGPLTVGSKGILEGTGSVGNVTAVSSGTILPGAIGSMGILSAQSVNLSNGGILYIQIAGYQTPGSDFSKLDTGSLILGGTSKLTLNLSGLTNKGTVHGMVTDGSQSGTFSTVQVINNPSGFGDAVLYSNDNIDVTLS